MSSLFETSSINGLMLSNRFVRSATWEGLAAPDGAITPELVKRTVELARGGVGLIIGGHTHVSREGQVTPWQLGIYKDEFIPGLKRLTDAVHENNGKIIMQLTHSGIFADETLTRQAPLVVSSMDGFGKGPQREITQEDIKGLISAFSSGAKRAQQAGFDGIQLHSAHGYLLGQFLSPLFNKRNDEYGGSIQNRARIHCEICRSIRAETGHDFPLFIKMNCDDFLENGLPPEESLQAALLFEEAGFDAIELSGGTVYLSALPPSRTGINHEGKEAYFKEYALMFKKAINIPLILVGGIRSFEVAEMLLNDGIADYIAMSRPFIREPDLINRWKSGDRQKSKCISDNACFKPGLEGRGVYCVTREREEKRKKGV
ncbi:MAG: NADH:flavin oxidoreductase [Syntrophus sp. (in: bacteria)]|nr:NADH:flavin oxidoreductase [Syntrophus sp. (in: bacteria)]